MKKIIAFSIIGLVLYSCGATTSTSKQEINAGTYIDQIDKNDLSKHLHIVAGDEMQGRDTGSEGQKKSG